MNSILYNSNFPRGIRHYGCIFNKFYMNFIHKFKNYNLSSSFFNVIFSIVRKFSPIYGSFFIVKVNTPNSNTFKQLYDLLNDGFHSSVKINYKECKVKSFFGISRDFYTYHLYSSSSFFNLCSSWNINGWNSEKRDGVMYLNSVFKP
ncbi:hypothetical protein H8356DRAFT_1653899, partial [Neocallimastix lanati (nom. inval.)]